MKKDMFTAEEKLEKDLFDQLVRDESIDWYLDVVDSGALEEEKQE